MTLLFGTAGIPVCVKARSSVNGIKKVRELGLDCMELEFVHGMNMSSETAVLVNHASTKYNVRLTAHAPFFINLNAIEPQKRAASRSRILKTAQITNLCGGFSITFHAAYYLKQDPKKVYGVVKQELKKIVDVLQDEGNKVWLRPELTGKATQWGSITELIKISQDLEQVLPCVDFAHYHAREIGKHNSYNGYAALLEQIENGLGREALNNMHIHISGIEYSEKGERKHLVLKDADINYKAMLKACKDFKISGVVICESPNIEQDALLMKQEFEKI